MFSRVSAGECARREDDTYNKRDEDALDGVLDQPQCLPREH